MCECGSKGGSKGGCNCVFCSRTNCLVCVFQGYVREIYALVAEETDWPAFRQVVGWCSACMRVCERMCALMLHPVIPTQYYRWGPGLAADQPLPPLEPLVASAEQQHGRDALQ